MGRIIDKISERRRQRQRALGRLASTASSTTCSSSAHPAADANATTPPFFYSFEFFPPKTEAGLDNLLTRIDRMAHRLDPLFIDVIKREMESAEQADLFAAKNQQSF